MVVRILRAKILGRGRPCGTSRGKNMEEGCFKGKHELKYVSNIEIMGVPLVLHFNHWSSD